MRQLLDGDRYCCFFDTADSADNSHQSNIIAANLPPNLTLSRDVPCPTTSQPLKTTSNSSHYCLLSEQRPNTEPWRQPLLNNR